MLSKKRRGDSGGSPPFVAKLNRKSEKAGGRVYTLVYPPPPPFANSPRLTPAFSPAAQGVLQSVGVGRPFLPLAGGRPQRQEGHHADRFERPENR